MIISSRSNLRSTDGDVESEMTRVNPDFLLVYPTNTWSPSPHWTIQLGAFALPFGVRVRPGLSDLARSLVHLESESALDDPGRHLVLPPGHYSGFLGPEYSTDHDVDEGCRPASHLRFCHR